MTSTSSIMAAALNHFNNSSVEQDPFRLHVICYSQNMVCRSDWIPSLPFLRLFLSLTECAEHMVIDQIIRLKNLGPSAPIHIWFRSGRLFLPIIITQAKLSLCHVSFKDKTMCPEGIPSSTLPKDSKKGGSELLLGVYY